MPLAPGSRLGPYEILAPLGAGAMGEVYRARDPRLGREVALKILPNALAADAERLRRFEQEARAAGRLDHPNLLLVHDVGAQDGTPYIVTELLEGETLRTRLSGDALPVSRGVSIAIQIARGLAAAHERGIIHRDLKPENLFLLRDGRVKILDFGIAKLTQPGAPSGVAAPGAVLSPATPTITSTPRADTDPNIVLGTLGYMSPEQVRGLPIDHRSDLFAFGAVFYEMLSGRRAFRGATSADTMTAILREEPSEVSRDDGPISPALDRIVRHCLEKEPAQRFQSAADIAFALEALTGLEQQRPKTPWSPNRRFWAPALVVLGGLLLAAGLWAGSHWLPRGGETPETSYQKLTFEHGVITGARFASDGRSVIYSAEWDGRDSEVFGCDPQSPGSQRSTLAAARVLSVSRSNELAVIIDALRRPHNLAIGTLARVPALGGLPRKVLNQVMAADWAPDGASLAVVHWVGSQYRLEYPIGRVLYTSPGWISHIRVSPDGEQVAILDHPVWPDDRGSVVVVDRNGKSRVLARGWGSVQGVGWSPRGHEIWFTAARTGSDRSLYAVNLAGQLRVLISAPTVSRVYDISRDGTALIATSRSTVGMRGRAPDDPLERELSWLDWTIPAALSPDGRNVLFSEEGSSGGAHYAVCLRGTDGSPPVRLGEGLANDLSPDGVWALTTRFWTSPDLVLLPTGAGEPRVLSPTGLENIAKVHLLPNGDRIVIIGNEPGHTLRAYVRRLDGGPLRPITPEGAILAASTIDPQGRWLAVCGTEAGPTLYSLDGGPSRHIPGTSPEEVPLGWSHDSKSVYVTMRPSEIDFPVPVYKVEVETGSRSRIMEFKGPADSAGTHRGFALVGRDAQAYVYSYNRTLDDLYLARGLR